MTSSLTTAATPAVREGVAGVAGLAGAETGVGAIGGALACAADCAGSPRISPPNAIVKAAVLAAVLSVPEFKGCSSILTPKAPELQRMSVSL